MRAFVEVKMKRLLIAIFLHAAVASGITPETEERLLIAANQNLVQAAQSYEEIDRPCFLAFLRSAIIKLDAIESIDTVQHVRSFIPDEALQYACDVWRYGLAE